MSKFENDLTKGNVFTQLVLFAIPFFISNLIQSAYSVIDMIILGNFAGSASIAAVNTSSQIMIIITNLATGLATGGTVMIGQYLGANKKELINRSISTMLLTLFWIGVVSAAITLIFMNPILDFVKVPEEAYVEAKQYLLISVLGMLFIYGYNALSAIMRGLGDSKTPLVFVTFAGVLNIILDLVLVAGFHKGASGAAFATVFSQGLSMVLCIIYLKKNDFQFDFKLSSFKMDNDLFATLMKVGLPSGIQQVCNNFSFLFLTSLINGFGGVAASAASGIVLKFNAFAILPSVAISSSVSAMISQNMGAGKEDRVRKTTRYGFILCILICAIVFLVANIFSEPIFHIFGADKDVIEVGVKYMHAFSFEYVFLPLIIGFNSVFIGTGNGWVTLVSNLISSFIVRMPVAYLLGAILGFGVIGVGYSIPIATAAGTLVVAIFYMAGTWKKNRVNLELQ